MTRPKIHSALIDSISFTYLIAALVFATWTIFKNFAPDLLGLDKDGLIALVPLISWIAALCLLSMVVFTEILKAKGLRTLGEILFGEAIAVQEKPFYRSFWGLELLLIFCLSVYVSIYITEASLRELFDPEGLAGAARLWRGLVHPNWSILNRALVEAVETIFIAFFATVLAVPAAFFLAFFAARNLMQKGPKIFIYSVLRFFINLSRSIEPLVWALIFSVWVGIGPFAGMMALFIHSVASLIKYYSEVIEGINEGPLEAIRSTGANELQVVWFGVVPQVILPYIAMTLYRWDTNLRMATVIGLVGGGGIGTLLITYQGQAMWSEVGCIIVVIAAIVWLMDTMSALVREALK